MIEDSEESRKALEAFNADMGNIAKLHDIKRLDKLREDAVEWATKARQEMNKYPRFENGGSD